MRHSVPPHCGAIGRGTRRSLVEGYREVKASDFGDADRSLRYPSPTPRGVPLPNRGWGGTGPGPPSSSIRPKPDLEQDRFGEIESVIGLVAVPAAAHHPASVVECAFLDAQQLDILAGRRLGEAEAQAQVGAG